MHLGSAFTSLEKNKKKRVATRHHHHGMAYELWYHVCVSVQMQTQVQNLEGTFD